ncbi:MAG: hypothetical protein FJ222_11170 [Lentisphaerae bacterium]|nr:hypothetical protein [Lentisphaerota bacterium]
MGKRIRSVRLLIVGMIVVAMAGFGLYWWLTQYYFPVRDVVPIVMLLEKKDFRGAESLIFSPLILPNGEMERLPDGMPKRDPNRIRIRGRGAEKIKRVYLNVLNTAEDAIVLREALGCAFGCINDLLFTQSEGEILEKAVARYNAQIPASSSENPWSVTVGSDGYYYVQMGGFRSH